MKTSQTILVKVMNQLGIQKKNELKFHYFILILIITEYLPNLHSPSMPLIKT